MNILRITARWTGFPGAPGYSNFHFSSNAGFWDGGLIGDEAQAAADSAASRVKDAFSEIAASLPDPFRIEIEGEAELIDSDTGEILNAIEVSETPVSGRATNDNYAGPVGAVVNWRTADYRFGRRIRGRTFLVPLTAGQLDSDGTLGQAGLVNCRSFASTLLADGADPQLGVWSRPRDGAGGVFATVTGYTVPDMAAVLRSRRD